MNSPVSDACKHAKWMVFDLDDTLWDFSANSREALRQLYSKYAVLADIYDGYAHFFDKYEEENHRLWQMFARKEIDADTLKPLRFQNVLTPHVPLPEARQTAAAMGRDYLDLLAQQTMVVPGAIEVLRRYSPTHLIGVLSNGFNEVQYRKLYRTSLARYVQRMVVSDETGIPKPDRRIFDYMCREVGARPEEMVMIGDNPDTDIAGAVAAGWQAIFLDRKQSGAKVPEGVAVITDLREML